MNLPRTFARTLLACLAAFTALTAASAAAAGTGPSPGRPAIPALAGLTLPSAPVVPPPGHVFPLWRLSGPPDPDRDARRQVGAPGGYSPAELRAYLGLRGSGAGQTVAVTEAFDVNDPLPVGTYGGQQDDVTDALAAYDSWYGLPQAHLRFVAPHGTLNTLAVAADAYGWMTEATLDVETIHALVPRAAIVVVEGHDDALGSMTAAVRYAQTLHPAAVSNSWTEDEFAGEDATNVGCTLTGAPCVFSSGDCGSYYSNPPCAIESVGGFPAADPRVLAVGGTTLDLSGAGKVLSETAWSGSGGGVSRYEPIPGYQRAADRWHAGRGIPDVSFDADPNSGLAIFFYLGISTAGVQYPISESWSETGGTSVGPPAWAAILASTDQLRAAAGKPSLTIAGLHAALYAASKAKPVADITTGVNGLCDVTCQAGPGYDLVTGEGSPRSGIDSYLARY